MCDHTVWPKHEHHRPMREFISILQREEKVLQALPHTASNHSAFQDQTDQNLNVTHKGHHSLDNAVKDAALG